MNIAIIGAGLIGRLLALSLNRQDCEVTLIDRDSTGGADSCAHTGAGMLAPYSELEVADPVIFLLGRDSVKSWKQILATLHEPVFLQQAGTLAVAHPLDNTLLDQFMRRVSKRLSELSVQHDVRAVNQNEIANIEPSLASRFATGVFLPEEGQIDNRQLLKALSRQIKESSINWKDNTEIDTVDSNRIFYDGVHHRFDWVIDCRGLGAQHNWKALRAVRGEIIDVYAPEVSIVRPIRFMHPRYPIYIVPRQNKRFLIGATSIESADRRPITVQSSLELLSAAFSLEPAFAEASIVETRVNCRPALPDNVPGIVRGKGLIRVNGLYRHGFLVAPKLAELVVNFLCDRTIDPQFSNLFAVQEEKTHANRH